MTDPGITEQDIAEAFQELMQFGEELRESAYWQPLGAFPDDIYGVPASSSQMNPLASPRRSVGYSYRYDRADGRYLPYYENELDLRRQRAAIRNIAGFTSIATGAVETLNAFVINTGYSFTAKARNESAEESLKPLIDQVQRVIDRFVSQNNVVGQLDQQMHIGSREEGESIIALYSQPGYVARAVSINPDELTEPANVAPLNRMLGTDDGCSYWEFGVHTRYSPTMKCHDTATPLHYHIVRDDAGQDWDVLPAERVVHIKRNVPPTAKRGISDYLRVVEDMQGESEITQSTTQAMKILTAIPFVKEFPTATGSVRPPGADTTTLPTRGSMGTTRSVDRQRYHPGTIPELAKGAKYVAGPLTQMRNDAVIQFFSHLLKRIGMFWGIPPFMMQVEADTQLYSAVLAIGSPFVRRREQDQAFYGNYFVELITKALKIAWDTNQLRPVGVANFGELMHLAEITYQAPTVALTDDKAQSEADAIDIQSGVLSVKTAQQKRGLDPDQEQQQQQEQPTPVQQAVEMAKTDPIAAAARLREAWGAYP
jgi:hypothetical protein